jgi:hypothetical protein
LGKILDWISNKLTELSIAQIPGYSEEDKELLKKWDNITSHIRDDRKKLLTSKMLENQTTLLREVVEPEKIVEKKQTKTERIMEFFDPPEEKKPRQALFPDKTIDDLMRVDPMMSKSMKNWTNTLKEDALVKKTL